MSIYIYIYISVLDNSYHFAAILSVIRILGSQPRQTLDCISEQSNDIYSPLIVFPPYLDVFPLLPFA